MTASSASSLAFSTLEKRAIASLASLYGFRMLGLFMVLPVLALHIDDYLGATPLLLGVTLGIYGFTQALFQIPLGLLSDKIGRAPVIIAGLILFVLGSVIAATADTIGHLIVGRAVQGMGAIASTLMATVTDLTSEENRTKAMAFIGASIGLSFMLAMILGPLIAASSGLSGIFWLTVGLGILGIALFIFIVPRAISVQKNRETLADISQIVQLLKEPTLIRLNLGVFVLHLALMAAFVIIPSILSLELAIATDNLWWVYLALLGGGFFLMMPLLLLGERYSKQKLNLVCAVALMAMSVLVLGLQRGALLTPLMLLLFFAAFNLLEASLPSWLSKACPAGNRGTAMGIYSTSQFFGVFVGGLLGGWSLQFFGIDGLFILLAAILALWWILALGLRSPRALQTLVLSVGEMDHQDFTENISNIAGVEDILLVQGEQLAYVRVDRQTVDMSSLKPYFNR